MYSLFFENYLLINMEFNDFFMNKGVQRISQEAPKSFVSAKPKLSVALGKFRCGARNLRCGAKEIYVEEVIR